VSTAKLHIIQKNEKGNAFKDQKTPNAPAEVIFSKAINHPL
jgi:hypothetical protein